MGNFKGAIGDWMAALFLLALVYMLVKPSSPASSAVSAFTGALSSLITTTIGSSNGATPATQGAQQ